MPVQCGAWLAHGLNHTQGPDVIGVVLVAAFVLFADFVATARGAARVAHVAAGVARGTVAVGVPAVGSLLVGRGA